MRIAMLCKDSEITNFVGNLEDLDKLIRKANPTVFEFFQHAFMETTSCKEIGTLDWISERTRELVRHDFSFITTE